jgi:hypothetical protein
MKLKFFSLAAAAVLLLGMSSLAKADTWTLAPDLTASSNYSASGGNFTLTFTITNNSGTDAGIYDFSLNLTGGNGSVDVLTASGSGTAGAGFEFWEDTKQNNGSGTTCNDTNNSGWLCVDYTGGFDTIASGGSLTWTFTGTYTGDPVDIQHLMAQGCIDVTDTWETHGPGASSGNCPFNGAGSYNISLDGTPQVPEPGSLMLFGTGLLGMAGFVRRKLMS